MPNQYGKTEKGLAGLGRKSAEVEISCYCPDGLRVSQLFDIREITLEGNFINGLTTGKKQACPWRQKMHFSVLGSLVWLFASLER